MGRTSSIIEGGSWKKTFAALIKSIAEDQAIEGSTIGAHLDRFPGSTGRKRVSDWWRYANEGRIPTELQVVPLSQALRIPLPVMRVCAGYIDDIFECVYAAALGTVPEGWAYPVEPGVAALSLLFSLFPNDEMHIGNRGSLFTWMAGNIIHLNLSSDEGLMTGEEWNSIWLYPVRSEEHLIPHHETPDDPHIVWVGEPRTAPWTWYSMRALLQVDLASPAASHLLRIERIPIPKTVALLEAQQILHRKTLSLELRLQLAGEIVHHWADRMNSDLATEVREHLHPWIQRTISDDAARWVRGEPLELADSEEDDAPKRVVLRGLVPPEMEGRPYPFWS